MLDVGRVAAVDVEAELLLEDDDGTRCTLSFDELNLPSTAGPLLAYLEERASPREPE